MKEIHSLTVIEKYKWKMYLLSDSYGGLKENSLSLAVY